MVVIRIIYRSLWFWRIDHKAHQEGTKNTNINYELWSALIPDTLRYRTGILMQKKLRRMELEIFFIQINQIFTIYY